MALIKCSKCNHKVLDTADACPKCGLPISGVRETDVADTKIKTVQETSTKYKLHTLISVFLIIIGVVWAFVINNNPQIGSSDISGLLMLIGFGWYIVTRFRIWWHNR